MLTPQQFQEKHARRLKGAIDDMRTGINNVTEAPTMKAAAKQEKMKSRLVASLDSGIWASRLRKVTLEEWKSKTLDKGLNRVAGGIDAAADKVIDFAGQLLPAITGAQGKIATMPDVTLEDSINRMNTFVREMAKFRKK